MFAVGIFYLIGQWPPDPTWFGPSIANNIKENTPDTENTEVTENNPVCFATHEVNWYCIAL